VHAETKGVLKQLGLRIGEVRRAQKLTQDQAAERLGMHTPNYARIEQGAANVTVDTLVRISSALKVRVADLFQKPKIKRVKMGRPKREV
jgi:transcriptional regulator with XRE-family HTH domain